MNIDFSKVFANVPKPEDSAKVEEPVKVEQKEAIEQANKIVHGMNEPCECGHLQADHEQEVNADDPTEQQHGACNVLECPCISFFPASEVEETVKKSYTAHPFAFAIAQADPTELALELPPNAPSTDITEAALEADCAHLCDCGKWWSHGPKNKCRHPEVLKQGHCQDCLKNGLPKTTPMDDFVDGKLTKDGIIRCYNAARETCKNMTVEQLTHHIEYNAKRIEELRAANIQVRRMRAEAEEEALKGVPDSERESFRETLRTGKVKEKKEKKAPMSAMEKNIQSLMKNLNKTREEVEKYLND